MFMGTVMTDLRGILSLPDHIITKIAAAHALVLISGVELDAVVFPQ